MCTVTGSIKVSSNFTNFNAVIRVAITSCKKGQSLQAVGIKSVALVFILFPPVPGVVVRPPEVPPSEITSTSALVQWSPPSDPNGVIRGYVINYVVISSDPGQFGGSSNRRRRQANSVATECIMGGMGNVNRNMTVDGTQTSAQLNELSELNGTVSTLVLYINFWSFFFFAPRTQHLTLCTVSKWLQ